MSGKHFKKNTYLILGIIMAMLFFLCCCSLIVYPFYQDLAVLLICLVPFVMLVLSWLGVMR